jgi:hypothetical protein
LESLRRSAPRGGRIRSESAADFVGIRSKRAIEVNIAIMRTFVRLREMISSNKALARRLTDLEKKYDGQFQVVFEARWEGHPDWSCAPGTRALRKASFDGRT